jgi:hypothetical protein
MMMVAVRPEMIQTLHLMSQSLSKPAPGVNPRDAPKNRYVERVFWMLAKIDFRRLLRYFRLVLGRGAVAISSGACFSDQLRTPTRKGQGC